MNPDVIFIATGSRPCIPGILGVDKDIVITAAEVLLGKSQIGQSVIIVGGNHVGAE